MSDQRKDGGAAFPLPMAVGPAGDFYDATNTDPGMSIRDWFAGQALSVAAIRVACRALNGDEIPNEADAAKDAYEIADAMLRARGES